MTNVTNIIEFRSRQKRVSTERQGVVVTERQIKVVDDDYRVRRVVATETGRGFATIYDAAGKARLIFSSTFPNQHVAQLIVAMRAGYEQGLERGRREGGMGDAS